MSAPLITRLAAICASGLLLGAYANGYYALGFVALVPWLTVLARGGSWRAAICDGALMSMAYTMAALAWLGAAMAAYTDISRFAALLLMCLLAPLWQPQFWLYALSVALTRGRAVYVSVWIGIALWIVSEWLLPKALGDTLAYGLAPALWLRQGADIAGSAGLTALLLVVNAALALAWIRRKQGRRAALAPLLIALLLPAGMAAYGAWRLHSLEAYFAEPAPSIRVGMVQTSMVDYEQRRKQQGSYAVVREVLDRHFALSQAAIEQHGAEALLWSETVYPTPYGYPRSKEGAAFDYELKSFVQAAGVPLLFGSYDVDDKGEYNAAVLLEPQRELTARYRKTRLFPFTERVPSLLDYPWLRRLLPWVGTWQPGDGARVLPLRTRDGRELNVVPLICLDDVDPMLAIEGARLGAQAIVGLSNDSWFSQYPQGMELHLAVARFRSIETRLPQLRVTTNGYTAFIDPTGEVLARTQMGDQAVLAGMVPIRAPPASLVTRWGTWLGPAALVSLLMLALQLARNHLRQRRNTPKGAAEMGVATNAITTSATTTSASLLSQRMRLGITLLKASAALGLIYLWLAMLLRDGWRVYSTQQIYVYFGLVLLPLLLSWLALRWQRVRVEFIGSAATEDDRDVLRIFRDKQSHQHDVRKIAWLRAWRLPCEGVEIAFNSSAQTSLNLSLDGKNALQLLQRLGESKGVAANASQLTACMSRIGARSAFFDHAAVKFGLFPLLMALPAFRLHQVISFGGTFGEYLTFGAVAYLQGLAIWWASWSLGLMLWAAFLRLISEVLLAILTALRPELAGIWRGEFELIARLLFYLAVPIWFAIRVLG